MMMQFKMKLRRITAFILSLCMLAGALPAQSQVFTAAAAEEKEAIVFDFAGKNTVSHTYGSHADNKIVNGNPNGSYDSTVHDRSYILTFDGKGGWVACDVEIPYSATFKAEMKSYKYASVNTFSVYLLPSSAVSAGNEVADIKTAISDSTYLLGKVEKNSTEGTYTDNLGTFTLTSGSYKLVFVNEEDRKFSTTAYYRSEIMELKLSERADVELDFTKEGAASGDWSVSPNQAAGGLSNAYAGNSASYAQIGSVATQQSFAVYKINNIPKGDYSVNAITYLSRSGTENLEYYLFPYSETVTGAQIAALTAADAAYLGSASCYVNGADQAEKITPINSGINIDEGGAYYLVVMKRESGKIGYLRGIEFKKLPNEYVFDFGVGAPEVLLTDIGYEDTNNTWKYHSYSKSTWGAATFSYQVDNAAKNKIVLVWSKSGILIDADSASKWVALELDIPRSGIYDLSLEALTVVGAGTYDIYLLPAENISAEADITAAFETEKPQARVDFYGVNGSVDLGEFKALRGGKYLMVMRGTGVQNESEIYKSVHRVQFKNLTLDRKGAVPDVFEVTTDKLKLAPGVSTKLDAAYYVGQIDRKEVTDVVVTASPSTLLSYDAESGKLTAAADIDTAAEVTVTVNAKYGGKDVSDSCTLQVAPLTEDYNVYDFVTDKESYPAAVSSNSVYAAKHDGYAYALNDKNAYFYVEIDVAKPGFYSVETENYLHNYGGLTNIHLIPAEQDIAEAIASGKYLLGEADGYAAADEKKAKTFSFGTVMLESAGKYRLVLAGTGKKNAAAAGYNAYINKLVLDGGAAASAQLSVNADAIYLNKEYETELTVKTANGTVIGADVIEVSYESDSANAQVDELGTVSAKSVGAAEITAAVHYGADVEAKLPINVVYPSAMLINQVEMTAAESVLEISAGTTLNVSATAEDGSAISLENATVTYTSGNTEIATVDANGNVMAVGAGSVELTAEVYLNGVTKYASCTVHIISEDYAPSLAAVDVVLDKAALRIGSAGKTTVNAVMNIGTSRMTFDEDTLRGAGATVTFSSGDETVATVAADGSYEVIGNGIAKIKAVVTYKDVTLSDELSVTVGELAGRNYTYNFLKASTKVWETTYDMTGNTWAYHTQNAGWVPSTATFINYGNGIQILLAPVGSWAAVKFKVPEPGAYHMELDFARYYGGADTEAYVLPIDTQDIPSKLTPENRVGTVDNYYINSVAEDLTSKYLDENGPLFVETPGEEFMLVFKSTDINSWGWQYLVGLNLIGINQFKNVDFNVDKTELEFCDDAERNSTSSSFTAYMVDGSVIPEEELKISYRSSDEKVVKVDTKGNITAQGEGSATVTISVLYNGSLVKSTKLITVKDNSDVLGVTIVPPEKVFVRGSGNISIAATMSSGNVITRLGAGDSIDCRVISMEPEGAATVTKAGAVSGKAKGKVTVEATVNFRGKEFEAGPITFEILDSEKGKSTIWTDEKREAILYNVQTDSTVRSKANSYAATADKHIENLDKYYDMIVGEGLPRFYDVGSYYSADKYYCRYCGVNVEAVAGRYGWLVDPLNSPWKVQCPACRRQFPSNDFGEYYKLGLNERGIFEPERAKQKHIELFGDKPNEGYLKNERYPEMDKKLGVEGWGVDDGFGYVYEYVNDNAQPVTDRQLYIAYYLHWGVWYAGKNTIDTVIGDLKNAYLYTGEAKYGRAGAILLDRVADFYPDFDWYQWRNINGTEYRGTILDPVWGGGMARMLMNAYDAFYPIYEDPQVISYLGKKSELWDMNPKDSAAALRRNVEDGIIRNVYKKMREGSIIGNFGMHQSTITDAAVILNTMPETKDWLDWMMAPGTVRNIGAPQNIQGLNTEAQLVSVIDRDGMGNESAPSYNGAWLEGLMYAATTLTGYELYPESDLFSHPKFIKMIDAQLPILMGGYYSAQIGDMAAFASTGKSIGVDPLIAAYNATGDIKYAQAAYLVNRNSAKGLRYADTVKDPESLEKEIQAVIDEYGELDLGSTAMMGYGLYALRDGKKHSSTRNTIRDFWMYTGTTTGHGHRDSLNLGIDAFGLNMGPELGYPVAGYLSHQVEWMMATISHNTVVVDEESQEPLTNRGTPMHFDDAGRVKLMDADKSIVYPQTDEYRRTVIMVEVDDGISYGVDFFRIVGGNDHLYSFHSQSKEIGETENLNLIAQDGITYAGKFAGKDVPYGPDPTTNGGHYGKTVYPRGYTWLKNVESDDSPANEFAVDFKITDFRNVLKDSSNLHLRMTMLNNFDVDEVSVTDGYPGETAENPQTNIKYVLVRNRDENAEKLDTLFTTVFEPYKGDRYLKKLEAVPVTYANGDAVADSEAVNAIKVTHTNNRVDYIVYAADNTVEYTIDGMFNFKGFVGVVTYADFDGDGTVKASDLAYTYLNDGEKAANIEGATVEQTGEVISFTEELSLDNRMEVKFGKELTDEEIADLIGRYIFVDNDGVDNGGYKIHGVKRLDEGNVELDIGDVTMIRGYINNNAPNQGYVYNIERGQKFRIPLSHVDDTAPTMEQNEGSYIAVEGSRMTFTITAKSDYDRQITYEAVSLPRGASFDEETATVSWTPDKTQIGEHGVTIKASDGVLSTSYNAIVTVYKSTGAVEEPTPDTPPGGGGGGGGASSGGDTADTGNTGNDTTDDNTDNNTDVGDDTVDVPSEKFIDLGNHAWAKESIYGLVDSGIVNGTSENTYSPAANIKRADFAIMLVRAFGITDGEDENFADVDDSKYYAEELRLAKANGIVNGVGDNNFNPEGEITRQDMMLMLTRALDAQGRKLSDADLSVLTQFTDAAEISEYARDAVSRVVRDGIITGANGRINPLGKATRAEVAVMLGRIFG